MLTKIRKALNNKKGFTLIELITVLVILGIILLIGIPRYMKYQERARWDADASTIKQFAKAAEVYAASHEGTTTVPVQDLITSKDVPSYKCQSNGKVLGSDAAYSYSIGTDGVVEKSTIEALLISVLSTRP